MYTDTTITIKAPTTSFLLNRVPFQFESKRTDAVSEQATSILKKQDSFIEPSRILPSFLHEDTPKIKKGIGSLNIDLIQTLKQTNSSQISQVPKVVIAKAPKVTLILNGVPFQPKESKRADAVSEQATGILKKQHFLLTAKEKSERLGHMPSLKIKERASILPSNGKKRKLSENFFSEEQNAAKRVCLEGKQQFIKPATILPLLPHKNVPKSGQVSQVPKVVAKISDVAKKIKWTHEDDQLLLEGHEINGNAWTLISEKYLKGKFQPSACLSRYRRVIHPDLKKGPWSEDERQKLLEAVEKYGVVNWVEIAKEVFNWKRSDSHCRQEYLMVLDPTIKHGKWTEEEEKKLIELGKQNVSLADCGREIGRSALQCRKKYRKFL